MLEINMQVQFTLNTSSETIIGEMQVCVCVLVCFISSKRHFIIHVFSLGKKKMNYKFNSLQTPLQKIE